LEFGVEARVAIQEVRRSMQQAKFQKQNFIHHMSGDAGQIMNDSVSGISKLEQYQLKECE